MMVLSRDLGELWREGSRMLAHEMDSKGDIGLGLRGTTLAAISCLRLQDPLSPCGETVI